MKSLLAAGAPYTSKVKIYICSICNEKRTIIYLLDNAKRIVAKRIDVETLEKMLEERVN